MNRKTIALLLTLTLAGIAWAGDPWKEKSYKEWDEKDVKKILTDSPWSRTVRVNGTWAGAGTKESDNPLPNSGRGGGGGPAPGAASGSPRSSEDREPKYAQVSFQVRWISSQTIREALARNSVLQGRAQESDAEKFIEQRPEEYRVAIVGEDMRPFSKATEDSLKEATYLMVKSSKQKLAPAKVEIHRTPDGKRVTSVVFMFTRKAASGEALIAPAEKDLEFSSESNHVLFKTNFSPQKMTGKDGLDL